VSPLHIANFTLTTCLGNGRAANWLAIAQQRTGLAACRFETVNLPTFIGEVAGVDQVKMPKKMAIHHCRNNQLALLGLQQDGFAEAVSGAIDRYGAHRVGVYLGTSTAGILSTELAYRERVGSQASLPSWFAYAQSHNTYSVAGFVREYFDLAGPAVVVSSACSSSAKVFGNAARAMQAGLIDAAIVGGVDSLCLTTLYGFNSLELLSDALCQPYDAKRKGISISEAAGFALLTREPASADSFVVTGIGESSDAHHMSSPHPEGAGALAAMRQALQMAQRMPEQVDYVNLHGTATKSNDAAEGIAVAALFGSKVACSSTKGHTGHALGAAGIIEVAIGLMAIEHGITPGGVNTTEVDPTLTINYLSSNQVRAPQIVLSNSFGFGGSNCSLVLERASTALRA
jgi:3-oxoacyl-[acyl-carrier-protein] synthase I